MRLFIKATTVLIFSTLTLVTTSCFASEDLFRQARQLQREGQLDEAINTYKNYLVSPFEVDSMSENQLAIYTDVLLQESLQFLPEQADSFQRKEAIELGKKYGISPSTIKRWLDKPQFTHLDLGKYAKVPASGPVNQWVGYEV